MKISKKTLFHYLLFLVFIIQIHTISQINEEFNITTESELDEALKKPNSILNIMKDITFTSTKTVTQKIKINLNSHELNASALPSGFNIENNTSELLIENLSPKEGTLYMSLNQKLNSILKIKGNIIITGQEITADSSSTLELTGSSGSDNKGIVLNLKGKEDSISIIDTSSLLIKGKIQLNAEKNGINVLNSILKIDSEGDGQHAEDDIIYINSSSYGIIFNSKELLEILGQVNINGNNGIRLDKNSNNVHINGKFNKGIEILGTQRSIEFGGHTKLILEGKCFIYGGNEAFYFDSADNLIINATNEILIGNSSSNIGLSFSKTDSSAQFYGSYKIQSKLTAIDFSSDRNYVTFNNKIIKFTSNPSEAPEIYDETVIDFTKSSQLFINGNEPNFCGVDTMKFPKGKVSIKKNEFCTQEVDKKSISANNSKADGYLTKTNETKLLIMNVNLIKNATVNVTGITSECEYESKLRLKINKFLPEKVMFKQTVEIAQIVYENKISMIKEIEILDSSALTVLVTIPLNDIIGVNETTYNISIFDKYGLNGKYIIKTKFFFNIFDFSDSEALLDVGIDLYIRNITLDKKITYNNTHIREMLFKNEEYLHSITVSFSLEIEENQFELNDSTGIQYKYSLNESDKRIAFIDLSESPIYLNESVTFTFISKNESKFSNILNEDYYDFAIHPHDLIKIYPRTYGTFAECTFSFEYISKVSHLIKEIQFIEEGTGIPKLVVPSSDLGTILPKENILKMTYKEEFTLFGTFIIKSCFIVEEINILSEDMEVNFTNNMEMESVEISSYEKSVRFADNFEKMLYLKGKEISNIRVNFNYNLFENLMRIAFEKEYGFKYFIDQGSRNRLVIDTNGKIKEFDEEISFKIQILNKEFKYTIKNLELLDFEPKVIYLVDSAQKYNMTLSYTNELVDLKEIQIIYAKNKQVIKKIEPSAIQFEGKTLKFSTEIGWTFIGVHKIRTVFNENDLSFTNDNLGLYIDIEPHINDITINGINYEWDEDYNEFGFIRNKIINNLEVHFDIPVYNEKFTIYNDKNISFNYKVKSEELNDYIIINVSERIKKFEGDEVFHIKDKCCPYENILTFNIKELYIASITPKEIKFENETTTVPVLISYSTFVKNLKFLELVRANNEKETLKHLELKDIEVINKTSYKIIISKEDNLTGSVRIKTITEDAELTFVDKKNTIEFEKKNKGNNKTKIIVISTVVAVLFVAIVIVAIFLISKYKHKKTGGEEILDENVEPLPI